MFSNLMETRVLCNISSCRCISFPFWRTINWPPRVKSQLYQMSGFMWVWMDCQSTWGIFANSKLSTVDSKNVLFICIFPTGCWSVCDLQSPTECQTDSPVMELSSGREFLLHDPLARLPLSSDSMHLPNLTSTLKMIPLLSLSKVLIGERTKCLKLVLT